MATTQVTTTPLMLDTSLNENNNVLNTSGNPTLPQTRANDTTTCFPTVSKWPTSNNIKLNIGRSRRRYLFLSFTTTHSVHQNSAMADPVAAKSTFLCMYMSNHPDTLVSYVRHWGKVGEKVTSAQMTGIDTQVRFFECKTLQLVN